MDMVSVAGGLMAIPSKELPIWPWRGRIVVLMRAGMSLGSGRVGKGKIRKP